MTTLQSLSSQIKNGQDLSHEQAAEAAGRLARESEDPAAKAEFLTALAAKGETAVEIAGFAGVFQKLARNPGLEAYADEAIDLCGTGGDGQGTVNISSITSLLVASTGVKVFKHGNRSITSKCGSADFLAALGIPLDLADEEYGPALEALNMVFFFAPNFHPAFKSIMPVRQALAKEGKKTIFNLLGPLINPGNPGRQLLGVYAEKLVPLFREALEKKGLCRGVVAHGRLPEGGLDEVSAAGKNILVGVGSLAAWEEILGADRYGYPVAPIEELRGGDLETNLRLFEDLLAGKATPGLTHSVLLNAAVALIVAGKVTKMEDGVLLAREQLLGGGLKAYLVQVREYFAGRNKA
ncbi:MAG: anthranilate phosphoribosyltransferase [Opitutales bacterium]|nr:anthranilate phosphoribosyltransferase [Opitutales bacterium]MCH8540107.1 anthranilate phosphoribosyltransferase [Opitutales bacterium]